jgi:ABC-type Fe3+/spermidine/putrescine transport system ATPase subunit
MALLTIKDLSKSFGDKKVIQKISFSLEKGEILSILGESGSGKTTLLHLIAALQEPDAGVLLLNDKAITPPSEKLIAGHPEIKLVRQDYGLFPNISIRENIAYELRFYEENYRNKRIDKLLKISGLQKVQDQLPRQVSGGEQQRTVIVKALAEEPKLLLLDEPFSHLDTRNKRKLKATILQIIREVGVSCIFVTHDVNDAFGMADRLVIMQRGKFLQMDTPQAIYENPINQYVAEMTGEINVIEVDEKSHFIRPESIKINKNPPSNNWLGVVESCKFMGSFYEIIVLVNNQKIKIFSEVEVEIGDEYYLEIKIS